MKKACGYLLCLLFAGLCACGQTSAEETNTESADNYFDMVWGWECPEGEFAPYVDDIYHAPVQGTAGSSAIAAYVVCLLEFSNGVSHENWQGLAPVFASMNDSQARHFSAQWIRLRALASEALRDPESLRERHGPAEPEDFDAALYSIERLESLDETIASFLLRQEMQ